MIQRLLEKDLLPDSVIRLGIRALLRKRLREEKKTGPDEQQNHFMRLVKTLKSSAIAVHTGDANEQHYELPTEFFERVLGRHMKYSSGLWSDGTSNLDAAEARMLALSAHRAELFNGQDILELGCGWGSMTLYMGERFPASRITAVSNSRTQKEYIDQQSRRRGLTNIEVITADMNDFTTDKRFDRVVSVEMFEHMRNYSRLLEKIAGFLKPDGLLFVHIFTHREYSYLFEVRDASDWMAKYFFTGGVMPSNHLLLYFSEHCTIENHWVVDGRHYQKTSEAWLVNMDRHRTELQSVFEATYGDQALKWWVYWRVFFMACAELWGFRSGQEWFVSHYLFRKNGR